MDKKITNAVRDGAGLTISIHSGDETRIYRTGIRGELIRDEFVVPFSSSENAGDCLRMTVRSIQRGEIDLDSIG